MTDTNFEVYQVEVINGVQQLTYKGEVLPHQTKSVVVQDVGHIHKGGKSMCEVTITVFALLKDTK